jgi:hypothetical protein
VIFERCVRTHKKLKEIAVLVIKLINRIQRKEESDYVSQSMLRKAMTVINMTVRVSTL